MLVDSYGPSRSPLLLDNQHEKKSRCNRHFAVLMPRIFGTSKLAAFLILF